MRPLINEMLKQAAALSAGNGISSGKTADRANGETL